MLCHPAIGPAVPCASCSADATGLRSGVASCGRGASKESHWGKSASRGMARRSWHRVAVIVAALAREDAAALQRANRCPGAPAAPAARHVPAETSAKMKFSDGTGTPCTRRSIASWPACVIASDSGPCRN